MDITTMAKKLKGIALQYEESYNKTFKKGSRKFFHVEKIKAFPANTIYGFVEKRTAGISDTLISVYEQYQVPMVLNDGVRTHFESRLLFGFFDEKDRPVGIGITIKIADAHPISQATLSEIAYQAFKTIIEAAEIRNYKNDIIVMPEYSAVKVAYEPAEYKVTKTIRHA